VANERALSHREVDCQLALAYDCGMKPSGELGFKDFPTPHALTMPRLLFVTAFALCGALTWMVFQKPWGRIGYGIFNLLGIVVGLLIAFAILQGRLRLFFPLPLCRRGKCRMLGRDYVLEAGHPFWIRNERQLPIQMRVWGYVRSSRDAIMELLPDDTRRPYKRLVGFRKWADD
jgi:hypothetical protein